MKPTADKDLYRQVQLPPSPQFFYHIALRARKTLVFRALFSCFHFTRYTLLFHRISAPTLPQYFPVKRKNPFSFSLRIYSNHLPYYFALTKLFTIQYYISVLLE